MKILFLGRHYTYFRNFESVLRELARRGHSLHLAVERDETLGGNRLIESLTSEFPGITCGIAPGRPEDDWGWTAGRLRLGLDYLRYQHPVFDTAHKLRSRARERTPGAFVALGDAVHGTGHWSRRLATGLLHRLERAIPAEPAIRGFIEDQRPDIILLTPLIDLGSSQIEYLRAAHALRIPVGLCVWSWDHLSSKALIRDWPDRVFVWNETQKHEAVDLHGLPADRVVVTGAQCFDQWFDRTPSRDRAAFCREVGLAADRPYVLYVCSALFQGSPVEARFVLDWVQHLRNSASSTLRDAGILIRPHPSRLAEWEGIDPSGLGAVIWGSNPVDAQAKADYFDSLYHSAAVVGLNTSAFIEAGIVGRPVHTIIVPEFEANQTATVHFDYLLRAGGGLLTVARSFEEHARQIQSALADPPAGLKPFVREFVRPHGLEQAATPIFVEAVEQMRGMTVHGPVSDRLAPVWQWAVQRLARTRQRERLERWTLSEREYASAERIRQLHREKAIRRAALRAASDSARQERLRQRAERLERERQVKAAKEAEKQRRRAAKDTELAARRREKSHMHGTLRG